MTDLNLGKTMRKYQYSHGRRIRKQGVSCDRIQARKYKAGLGRVFRVSTPSLGFVLGSGEPDKHRHHPMWSSNPQPWD